MLKKKKEVTTIYIVRHGESESNVYARENPEKPASHFGEFGSSLTQKGREQTKKLAQRLQKVTFAAIFSSDLSRAKETAEIIASERKLTITTSQVIRERFFGGHMSYVQKREIEKALETLNEEEKLAFRYFPNGENGYEVIARFKKFLIETINKYTNETILVIGHAHSMRLLLTDLGFAKFDELPHGSINNGGYFVIETDGKTFTITEKYGITRNRDYYNEE